MGPFFKGNNVAIQRKKAPMTSYLTEEKIGFMQGRLCKPIDNKIQAFPWEDWQGEFQVAKSIKIKLMEWTLDHHRLYENPIMKPEYNEEIRHLCHVNSISIPSLTGDCFMQAPFWKTHGQERQILQTDFLNVCRSCYGLGIGIVVVPLVDNGSVESESQRDAILEFVLSIREFLCEKKLMLAFESDYSPEKLADFIERFPSDCCGVNYDIGNSASLGYCAATEMDLYGSRIINVHVKDRLRGGQTVPLTTGDANFEVVFGELLKAKYAGNFILQTARDANGEHAKIISTYRDMLFEWISVT